MYHAIIGQIAKQAEHAGARWSADDWKRLLVDQFAKDTGRQTMQVVPSLDGGGIVQLGMQTRKFSKADASEFTEWLICWATDKGFDISQ